MNAIEKIVHIAETVAEEKGDGEMFANKIRRSTRKGDLSVVSNTDTNVIVATNDNEVYRIINSKDPGFAAFAQYMGRKSSVLLPKLKKVTEASGWVIYQTEELEPLAEAVGDKTAAEFYNWANQYISTRHGGKKASRGLEFKPPVLGDLVNYGNLRGLLNKLISHAKRTGVKLNTDDGLFMVRNGQLVINDPMAA